MPALTILKLVVLFVVTAAILYVSRPALWRRGSHGFYRLFAWQASVALIVLNGEHWFDEPFSVPQIISWLFLAVSLFLVIHGVRLLRGIGKQDAARMDAALIGLEKTTTLVTVGAYRYVRHPLYSSLLFLTWGVFLKDPSWLGAALAVLATLFLTATARVEEAENTRYFGTAYGEYMKHTRMFIPHLF